MGLFTKIRANSRDKRRVPLLQYPQSKEVTEAEQMALKAEVKKRMELMMYYETSDVLSCQGIDSEMRSSGR